MVVGPERDEAYPDEQCCLYVAELWFVIVVSDCVSSPTRGD